MLDTSWSRKRNKNKKIMWILARCEICSCFPFCLLDGRWSCLPCHLHGVIMCYCWHQTYYYYYGVTDSLVTKRFWGLILTLTLPEVPSPQWRNNVVFYEPRSLQNNTALYLPAAAGQSSVTTLPDSDSPWPLPHQIHFLRVFLVCQPNSEPHWHPPPTNTLIYKQW